MRELAEKQGIDMKSTDTGVTSKLAQLNQQAAKEAEEYNHPTMSVKRANWIVSGETVK